MRVRTYVLRRLLMLPLVLLTVSILVFGLTRVGGSPIGIYVHPGMSQDQIQAVENRLGLDESLPEQYLAWLGNVLTGDLGWSAISASPVTEVLVDKMAATAELALGASVLILLAGIGLGTYAATHRDKAGDHVTRVLAISGASLPLFWFALLVLLLFYLVLGWAPIGRADTATYASIPHPTGLYTLDAILAGSWRSFVDAVNHLWLPSVVLAFQGTAVIARVMRSSLVDELGEDYVDAARAKGLSNKNVIRHARRNAMIPTVTVGGVALANLLQGVVVVELIFQLPGMGKWITDAVLRGDQGTVMAFVLIAAVLYIIMNLLVDVLYAYLDPRLELGT